MNDQTRIKLRPTLLILTFSPLLLLLLFVNTFASAEPAGGGATVNLPVVMKAGDPGAVPLEDGGTVTGVDGVTIGAVSGSLTATLNVTISLTTPPTQTVAGGAQPLASYYQLTAERDAHTFGAITFILGLPVPTGAPTDTLGIALFEPADGDDPADWFFLTGRYDASQGLMLVTLPYLSSKGHTVALVDHPALQSPPNMPPLNREAQPENQPAGGTQFGALCLIEDEFDREFCELDKGEVEAEFQDFFGNLFSMGFPNPLIYTQAEAFNIITPTVSQSLTYVILIDPGGSGCNSENGILGFYRVRMQQVKLCFLPTGSPLPETAVRIIRHEHFHATQAAFPGTWADFIDRSRELWITEGAASVAEESDQLGMNRTPWRTLHYVDRSLKSIEGADEYRAQDFWVYLGRLPPGSGLDRFITLFQQGAKTEDVTNWIGSQQGLKDKYWQWVKNQLMIEDDIDFDGELVQKCTLQSQVVESTRSFDPYNEGSHMGALPRMTSHVIKLTIDPNLEGFDIIMFALNPAVPNDPDLRYKIYVDGETCTSVSDGPRQLNNLTQSKDYYVVVSNVDPEQSKDYVVAFD